MRIAMAQINLTVGAVQRNAERMLAVAAEAREALRADLVIFPELALTGYPPEDLLYRRGLYAQIDRALQRLAAAAQGIDILVGYPYRDGGDNGSGNNNSSGSDGSSIYNAASLLRAGRVVATYYKQCLPNYSVFDEKRYFEAGSRPCIAEVKGVPLGITICEDAWHPAPLRQATAAGARLIVNLNSSPYHIDKDEERETVVRQRAVENRVPVVYVNLVGGQDELVFDGASFVMDAAGRVTQRSPAFAESLTAVDLQVTADAVVPQPGTLAPYGDTVADVYQALVLGVRDYIVKNRFNGAIVGVSGGVDSALTLAIAADAIGPAQVEALLMPSRYTAAMSLEDGAALCNNLGVACHTVAIEPPYQAFVRQLQDLFEGRAQDATEENIQARCRGVILMAVSNKLGKLVLTTGNKSELSVGYATLYGDMAGGFAVIKDVSKTLVYQLARHRNARSPVIPRRILERAPTAELRENQKDEDTLPPYAVLDPILDLYIQKDMGIDEIAAAGFDRATVARVVEMVQRNEYKRRQAPPGVRVTRRAFGRDRRYPITSGYTDD